MGDLTKEKDNLIKLSMSANSWKTYKTAVDSFNSFRFSYGFGDMYPAPIDHIAHFIAFLSHKGLAASTVSTYISGISHSLKIKGTTDNTKSFIISKMLEGLRRKNPQRPDVRTPISRDILKRIVHSLPFVCSSFYEACLFSSAFSLAFFAMLRVSEITVLSKNDESGHALNFEDVNFNKMGNQGEMHIKIRSSKTDQRANSITLIIQKQSELNICPVYLLQSYLRVRFAGVNGSHKLYVHFDGSALTRYQFCSVLQKCLSFCEVPFHIRSHSFRIGRATEMAKNGVDDETIKLSGRWLSTSYLKYIRI